MRQFVRQSADGRVSIIWASSEVFAAPGETIVETTADPIPRGQGARIDDGVAIPVPRSPAPDPAWALIPEAP